MWTLWTLMKEGLWGKEGVWEEGVWGEIGEYWTISASDTGCGVSNSEATYGPGIAVDDPKWDGRESQDLGRFILRETISRGYHQWRF